VSSPPKKKLPPLVFDDWLSQLADSRTQAKIATRINRLATGNLGNCKFRTPCLLKHVMLYCIT
jgi:putative component of toxin-antitoxin plasmid stabilization module